MSARPKAEMDPPPNASLFIGSLRCQSYHTLSIIYTKASEYRTRRKEKTHGPRDGGRRADRLESISTLGNSPEARYRTDSDHLDH